MKSSYLTIAVLGMAIMPTAAIAQDAPATTAASQTLTVGATIYGPQGGEVGKIESIVGDNVVINTGTSKATLPKSVFGSSDKGPTVTATKAQIDEMVAAASAKASAALDAALVPGVEVRGKSGALVGTVKEVSGDMVVVDRGGGSVRLSKKAFVPASAGVTISMTSAELDAAASAASEPADGAAESAATQAEEETSPAGT